jgi:predicted nucleic acid-binding protein
LATPNGQHRFLEELSGCQRVNLDTNILIYYLEDEPSRSELLAGLFRLVFGGSLRAVVSAIVQMELLVKAIETNDPNRAQRVIELTDSHPQVEVVDVTRAVVMQAAFARAEGFEVADAIVLATGVVGECDATITNDRRWRRPLARLARRPPMAHGDKYLQLPRMLYLDEFVDN